MVRNKNEKEIRFWAENTSSDVFIYEGDGEWTLLKQAFPWQGNHSYVVNRGPNVHLRKLMVESGWANREMLIKEADGSWALAREHIYDIQHATEEMEYKTINREEYPLIGYRYTDTEQELVKFFSPVDGVLLASKNNPDMVGVRDVYKLVDFFSSTEWHKIQFGESRKTWDCFPVTYKYSKTELGEHQGYYNISDNGVLPPDGKRSQATRCVPDVVTPIFKWTLAMQMELLEVIKLNYIDEEK